MELMKEDMQDSEKVRRWQLAGGIVDESEDISRPEEHNQNSDVGAASSKTSGAKKPANRANPASEPQCSRCHKALTCEPNGLEASVSCATRLFMRTRVCTDVNTAMQYAVLFLPTWLTWQLKKTCSMCNHKRAHCRSACPSLMVIWKWTQASKADCQRERARMLSKKSPVRANFLQSIVSVSKGTT